MTMTGDWTMVKDGDGNFSTETNTTTALRKRRAAAVRFPCSEQPPRFALRARRHGYYLGGTKKGKLVGRKKRSEKDEWTIAFESNHQNSETNNDYNNDDDDDDDDDEEENSSSSRPVTIHNHRFGNILSLVDAPKSDLGRIAACITPPSTTGMADNLGDLGLGEEEEEDREDGNGKAAPEQLPDDEEEEENDEDDIGSIYDRDQIKINLPSSETVQKEDLRWKVVRCSGADHPNGGVTIVSDKTGDFLGVTERGNIVLCFSNMPIPPEISHVWEMECVTGELCFLSNPSVDARVRCDMAGLLTLSPKWKGWEVVRITEASAQHASSSGSGKGRGYVRISSWMHSQWFLCSDSEGVVSSCSVAESLAPPPVSRELAAANNYRCSLWAIEAVSEEHHERVTKNRGVVLRSVTHGRLLSVRGGLLRTYDSASGGVGETQENEVEETNDGEAAAAEAAASDFASSDPNIGDVVKHHTEEVLRRAEEMKRKSNEWWKQSLTNVQKAVSESAMKNRNSKNPFDFRNKGGTNNGTAEADAALAEAALAVAEEETVVWQLEAAHQQTYYFLSAPSPISNESDEKNTSTATSAFPRSIGAFPSVTENLRRSDKIQFVRKEDDPDSLKLYLPDEHFFISCSSRGVIAATKQEEDEGTEWILEDTPGGSVFRSKQHGLYLSFEEIPEREDDSENVQQTGANADAEASSSPPSSNSNSNKKNPFENLQKIIPKKKKIPPAELCGTPTPCVWKLEPCTPRAISSKRLKTFAIGTSIAVGTTIAMPFALAGVAAAMGALGAEAGIGFGIVAAGLTGAEALASVGAIGATAYFCFRPEKNSLGGPGGEDDDENDDNEKDNGRSSLKNPWSKRPFSNWRNW